MGVRPPLLGRGDCALVAAEESEAVGRLCADLLCGNGESDAAVVAVTADPNPVALLDRWRRRDPSRFRDVSLLAVGAGERSAVATAECDAGLGLVRPLDAAVTAPELAERVGEQLREFEADGGRLAVYVDGLLDRYGTGTYLDLVDRLSEALSAHGAVGVFRLPADEPAIPALERRFGTVVTVDPQVTGPATDADPLPAGELFDALGSRRRVRVLRHLLARRGEPTSVADLASMLAREEGDASESAVRKRHVGLVHTDLPALEKLGLVTVGPDRTTVTPTERVASVEPFLTLIERTTAWRS